MLFWQRYIYKDGKKTLTTDNLNATPPTEYKIAIMSRFLKGVSGVWICTGNENKSNLKTEIEPCIMPPTDHFKICFFNVQKAQYYYITRPYSDRMWLHVNTSWSDERDEWCYLLEVQVLLFPSKHFIKGRKILEGQTNS